MNFQRRIQQRAQGIALKDEEWFLTQLRKATYPVLPRGRDFMIKCPFHDDSNPSCGVDRLTGVFHCFSCTEGRGHWNKLAEKLGMDKLNSLDDGREAGDAAMARVSRALKRAGAVDVVVKRGREKVEGSKPVRSEWPENKAWRGVSGEFLSEIGCVLVRDLSMGVDRIGLPVRTATGTLSGYVCGLVGKTSRKIPKYLPLAPDLRKKELDSRHALFLVDRVVEEERDRVVVVEGPYDALNLYASGIPAVAFLGTENWNKSKASILAGIGIVRALVLTDNDRAGNAARKRLVKHLSGVIEEVDVVKLPEDTKDPGDMDREQKRWLKKRLFRPF